MRALPDAARRATAPAASPCIGWDVGGAHLKACLVDAGAVRDVAQWPCPLWLGLDRLDEALARARERWPQAGSGGARHAVTMTGEMTDLFAHREDGVLRLAAHLAEALGPSLRLFAGEAGFVAPHDAGRHWTAIASANWRATAQAVAARLPDALLLDIGSTTSDLIAVRDGRVAARADDDAGRLATGELLYQGVVRTPLCAVAPRVDVDGESVNVMNEFFATTADVHRLTGELDPAHDQSPTADGGPKTLEATCRRIARLIGRDGRDRDLAGWIALARGWRESQVAALAHEARRVVSASGLPPRAPVVAAGCGRFLAASVAERLDRPLLRFSDVAGAGGAGEELGDWIDVCAPAVAVALAIEPAGAPAHTLAPSAAHRG